MISQYFSSKEDTIKLRSKGKTYSEIRKILGKKIPKSTLSFWCQKVALPKSYEKKVVALNHMNLTKAQQMAWVVHKENREKFLKSLWDKNKYLIKKMKDNDTSKMILSILQITEGGRWRSHRGLYFGSSDPVIMKLYLGLLQKCYGLKINQFKARICHRADQNLEELKKIWSNITAIPIENFYNSKPDPRTVGRVTQKKEYKGVCAVTCAGTHIQLELEAIPKILVLGV